MLVDITAGGYGDWERQQSQNWQRGSSAESEGQGMLAACLLPVSGSTVGSSSNQIAANRTGLYRPQIHYSPLQNFMNDPNGLFVDAEGTYHLYYQYNPTGLVAGNQHWGHATSQDLYHWADQPIAISPPTDYSQVFSGSAVVDVNNTSGFFPDQTNGVVAIYTLNTPMAQVQEIAYSTDGGYTFTRYDGNPVIDTNSTQFRDPKVIWHAETQRWVMVVAFSQEFVIGFYTSPDLKQWTHASDFSNHGLLGLQYECPNLVRMPVRDLTSIASSSLQQPAEEYLYVLTISINPGAPLGGSATEYFPGTFNGTHFTPLDGATRLTDFAKDNYAAQFFYGLPDSADALAIGWASNWQYAQTVPTDREGWRSAMSLPRRSFLTQLPRVGWTLVSTPVDLAPVLGAPLAARDTLGDDSLVVDYADVASNAIYLEVNVTGLPAVAPDATLSFTFRSADSGESLSGGYMFGSGTFFLNRGRTLGFDDPFFTDKFSTDVLPRDDGAWSLAVVIDRSVLEVFVNGGVHSATVTFFATQALTVLEVTAAGIPDGVSASVAVHALQSGWEDVAGEERRIR